MADSLDKRVLDFVAWFCRSSERLLDEPANEAADQVGGELEKVDAGLGVEVAERNLGENRELIVTAFSEPRLFPLVRGIVAELTAHSAAGWCFVALKPPRGFAFNLSLGGRRIDAAVLEFAAVDGVPSGVRLIEPAGLADASQDESVMTEAAWLIVETGIGEELSGRLEHIEFAREPERGSRSFPIARLADHARCLPARGGG